MSRKLLRREFLGMAAMSAAGAALAACQSETVSVPETVVVEKVVQETVEVEVEKIVEQTVVVEKVVEATAEPVSIEMWVQDWASGIQVFENAANAYGAKHPEADITVTPIPYSDLRDKMLPSVAAGTEGDIMFAYVHWLLGSDVSQVYLQISPGCGTRAEWEEKIFSQAFDALSKPGGEIYYIPLMSGCDISCCSINAKHYREQGLDYFAWETFDDMLAHGKELTITEGGKIVRAGLSPLDGLLGVFHNWGIQLGGAYYDEDSGVFDYTIPETVEAAQLLYDIIWTHKTVDYDLFQLEGDAYAQELVSTHFRGAYTVAAYELENEELDLDSRATPPLADAVEDVTIAGAPAVVALSRRLTDDDVKLNHCIGVIEEMISPDALLFMADVYSGSICIKTVYDDPRIEDTRFGDVSRRASYGTWPRARFNRHHVANTGPATTMLDQAMRQETSITEALAEMTSYMNEQEQTARERMGL